MQIFLEVKNFGKIKEAKINISNYTIFVGNNNSGKTQLMQLIYGVLDDIVNEPFDDYMMERDEFDVIDQTNIDDVLQYINARLKKIRGKIVKRIFKYDLQLDEIKISIEDFDQRYEIKSKPDPSMQNETFPRVETVDDRYTTISIIKGKRGSEKKLTSITFNGYTSNNVMCIFAIREIVKDIFEMRGNTRRFSHPNLFLPASRTGLMMLYRYAFSEIKEEDVIMLEDEAEEEDTAGLTLPMYHFLQYLMRYNPSANLSEENREILKFIEQHLLDGRLSDQGDTTFYQQDGTNVSTPLYLSSSMVNELTPIVKAVSGVQRFSYIFYDEVETCLHPLKQGEMARLLNRLNNAGKKLIISTHSDTMAAKINNLLLLSRAHLNEDERNRRLAENHLEEEDLLKSDDVYAYQFINNGNETEVSEMHFREVPFTGFDFALFNESAEKVYNETLTAMGADHDL